MNSKPLCPGRVRDDNRRQRFIIYSFHSFFHSLPTQQGCVFPVVWAKKTEDRNKGKASCFAPIFPCALRPNYLNPWKRILIKKLYYFCTQHTGEPPDKLDPASGSRGG